MSIFNKLWDMLSISDGADDYEDSDSEYDEYEDEEVASTKKEERKKAEREERKKQVAKPKKEKEQQDFAASSQAEKRFTRQNAKVVSMKNKNSDNTQMVFIKPTSMDDCQTIADNLLNGHIVILNLSGRIDSMTAQRITDYVAGTCYAIDGSFKAVAKTVFAIAPKGVDLNGQYLGSDEIDYKLNTFDKGEVDEEY